MKARPQFMSLASSGAVPSAADLHHSKDAKWIMPAQANPTILNLLIKFSISQCIIM